jgi:hypothetical protein
MCFDRIVPNICLTSIRSSEAPFAPSGRAQVSWAKPPSARPRRRVDTPDNGGGWRRSPGKIFHTVTRITRTVRVLAPQKQVTDSVKAFFSERPQLKVRSVGTLEAAVEVRYELLYDWTRVLAPRSGLALTWQPSWRGFPSFGATLTLQAAGEDTLLVLDGSYEPPGGAPGRLFDRLVGKRLAVRTMDALLRDIARQVTRQSLT